MQNAKDYLLQVEFKVQLNELYEVMASIQHVDGNPYCGVLIRIVDETIIRLNEGREYLVQVWRRGGTMVFEKSLVQPVCNWNITWDKFVFQQDPGEPIIYCVDFHRYRREERPKVYKFML